MKITLIAALLGLLEFSSCTREDYLDKSLSATAAMTAPGDRTMVLRRIVLVAAKTERMDIAGKAAKASIEACKSIPDDEQKAQICILLYASLVQAKRTNEAKLVEEVIVKAIDDIWDYYPRWFALKGFFQMDRTYHLNAMDLKKKLVVIASESLKDHAQQESISVSDGVDLAVMMSSADQKPDARRVLANMLTVAENSLIKDYYLEDLAIGYAEAGDFSGARDRALASGGISTVRLLAEMSKAASTFDKDAARKLLDEARSTSTKFPQIGFRSMCAILEAEIALGDTTAALKTAKNLVNEQGAASNVFSALDTIASLGAFDVVTKLMAKYKSPPPDSGSDLADLAKVEFKAGRIDQARATALQALALIDKGTSSDPSDNPRFVYFTLVGSHMFAEVKVFAEKQDAADRARLLQQIALEQATSGDEVGYIETQKLIPADLRQQAMAQVNFVSFLLKSDKRDQAVERAEKISPEGKAMSYVLLALKDGELPLEEE